MPWSIRASGISGRRARVAATVTAASLLLTSCATLAGPRATPTFGARSASARQPRWILTWDNEFNGSAGRQANWNYSQGGNGWAHKQLQYYTTTNALTDGRGHLVMTAAKNGDGLTCWYGPCKYTAARLDTLGIFSQAYGKFEARMKFPAGPGIWPGFWMESPREPACGELDIVETNTQSANLVEGYSHAVGLKHSAYLSLPQPLSSGYHVYGITWTPSGVTWTLDGRPYSHLDAYPGWPFHCPLFMILQLAVGGGWPGSPTRKTKFPARLSVDWVRVYREAS